MDSTASSAGATNTSQSSPLSLSSTFDRVDRAPAVLSGPRATPRRRPALTPARVPLPLWPLSSSRSARVVVPPHGLRHRLGRWRLGRRPARLLRRPRPAPIAPPPTLGAGGVPKKRSFDELEDIVFSNPKSFVALAKDIAECVPRFSRACARTPLADSLSALDPQLSRCPAPHWRRPHAQGLVGVHACPLRVPSRRLPLHHQAHQGQGGRMAYPRG